MILFLELNNVKNDFSTFDVTSNSVKCQLMMKLCCNSREVCVCPMALKAGDFPFCVDGGTHKDRRRVWGAAQLSATSHRRRRHSKKSRALLCLGEKNPKMW